MSDLLRGTDTTPGPEGREPLAPLVQDELRRIARGFLRRERPGGTLQTTALVNEAWLRLAERAALAPEDRQAAVRLASSEMRRILVDRARRRAAAPFRSVEGLEDFPDALEFDVEQRADLVDLDAGLRRLAEHDPRASSVVELVFFGGRSHEEAAEVLGVSTKTVQRDWNYASAYLRRELTRGAR
jgi:RNA polymerase sigma-70 factor (ECF subfamily)